MDKKNFWQVLAKVIVAAKPITSFRLRLGLQNSLTTFLYLLYQEEYCYE